MDHRIKPKVDGVAVTYFDICRWLLDLGLPREILVQNDDFLMFLYQTKADDHAHDNRGPYTNIMGCTIRPKASKAMNSKPRDFSAERVFDGP